MPHTKNITRASVHKSDAAEVGYNAGTPGDWSADPHDVEAALDVRASSHASHSADTTDPHGSTMSVSAKLQTPTLENAAGSLKIQPDVQGDVALFGGTDVGDGQNGKSFYVRRRAAEGDSYVRLYISSTGHAFLHSDSNLFAQVAAGKFIRLTSRDNLYIDLGDMAGSKKLIIRDSDNNTVATIDSNGNLTAAGITVSGNIDLQNNNLGFTKQTIGFTAPTIFLDWRNGNMAALAMEFDTDVMLFTNPAKPCDLVLTIKQPAGGEATIGTWDADILWPGGTAPTLSTAANAIDLLRFYWDGTRYFGTIDANFS